MGLSASVRPLAVVTGASSGIGFELARLFALDGFDLVVASRGPGIHNAARVFADEGVRVDAVRADLASFDGVEELATRVAASGRPVEVLALNAGVGVGGDFVRETSLRDELELIFLNCASTVHLAKRMLPDMVARRRGRVLVTASIAAVTPTPLEAVYGASKAFVLSFAESIRHELRGSGVTVTAMIPGPTDTNFFHRAGLGDTAVGAKKKHENKPADVARQGFDALMAGEQRILAGSLGVKLQGRLAPFIPESVKAEQHRRMAEHGSAHRR